MENKSVFNKYSYLWITLLFFIISIAGHWFFAWNTYVKEQEEHNEPVDTNGYVNQTLKDTFENWQSEFLQLMWQVGGLAFLLYVGSPQSKEGDDRQEEKIDAILRMIDPRKAKEIIKSLDSKYARNS